MIFRSKAKPTQVCPCKDCSERTETCHGSCDRYKSWKTQLDALNAKIRQANQNFQNRRLIPFWRRKDRESLKEQRR